MWRVLIESAEVNKRSGENAKGPWEMREQSAYIFLRNADGQEEKHPVRFVIQLDRNKQGEWQEPLAPGHYVLPYSAVFVGRYGELMFSRPRRNLVPAVAASSAARPASRAA
jgi:hypothetical protein